MLINKAEVDTIQDILATYRATPCLWVGTDSYSSTTLFGFYKDFNTVISYPTSSLLTLEIEGMT
jgi:hypothetical protein